MKSQKTFLPEFRVLNGITGVFYRNEQQYDETMQGTSEVSPFQRALSYGQSVGDWMTEGHRENVDLCAAEDEGTIDGYQPCSPTWDGVPFEPLVDEGDERFALSGTEYAITRCLHKLYQDAQKSTQTLIGSIDRIIGASIQELLESAVARKARDGCCSGLPAADASLGIDAFGSYLPFHAYAFSQTTPWGMYVFLEPLIAWTVASPKTAIF